MSVSYKKLWKLLIDKDMKKKDLCEKAGIIPALSTFSLTSRLSFRCSIRSSLKKWQT